MAKNKNAERSCSAKQLFSGPYYQQRAGNKKKIKNKKACRGFKGGKENDYQ